MKKLILTESQIQALLLEERLAWLLQESLNESKNFDEMKRKIKKALAMGVSVAVIIAAISKMNLPFGEKRSLEDLAKPKGSILLVFQRK